MTYTAAHHAMLSTYAATSQRDSARDGGLAIILTRLQDNRCFDCGKVAPLEFAHFVRAQGRTANVGNGSLAVIGAMACRACNLIHNLVCETLNTDGTLPLEYLTSEGRAERIPTAYPTRAECVRVWREASDAGALKVEAQRRMVAAGL